MQFYVSKDIKILSCSHEPHWNLFYFFKVFLNLYVVQDIFLIVRKDFFSIQNLYLYNFRKFFYNINSYKIFSSLVLGNFIKQGKRIKSLNLLSNYFLKVFYYNLTKRPELKKYINSPSSIVLKTFFKNNVSFLNLNFLIAWLSSFLNLQFNYVCKTVSKKAKKRKKVKYSILLEYIYTKKRTRSTLKFILNVLKLNNKLNKILKQSTFLFDLLFNYKKSAFYNYRSSAFKDFIKTHFY